MVWIVTRVAGMIVWPNASPQPMIPESVSTRTSRVSTVSQVRPAKTGTGPPQVKGILTWMVSIAVIFMCRCSMPNCGEGPVALFGVCLQRTPEPQRCRIIAAGAVGDSARAARLWSRDGVWNPGTVSGMTYLTLKGFFTTIARFVRRGSRAVKGSRL